MQFVIHFLTSLLLQQLCSVVLRLVEEERVHCIVGFIYNVQTAPARLALAEAFADAHARSVSVEWLGHDFTSSIVFTLAHAAAELRLASEACCLAHATNTHEALALVRIVACAKAWQDRAIDSNEAHARLSAEVRRIMLFLNGFTLIKDTEFFFKCIIKFVFTFTSIVFVTLRLDRLANFFSYRSIAFIVECKGLERVFLLLLRRKIILHDWKALFVEVSCCTLALSLVDRLDFFVTRAKKLHFLLHSLDGFRLLDVHLRVDVLVHFFSLSS